MLFSFEMNYKLSPSGSSITITTNMHADAAVYMENCVRSTGVYFKMG